MPCLTGPILVLGSPTLGNPIMGSPILDKRTLGNPTLGNPTLGNPILDKRTLGNPILDKRTLGNPTLGKRTLDNPILGSLILGSPTLGSLTLGSPILDSLILGKRTLGRHIPVILPQHTLTAPTATPLILPTPPRTLGLHPPQPLDIAPEIRTVAISAIPTAAIPPVLAQYQLISAAISQQGTIG